MERRVVYDSDAVQAGRCPTCAKRMDRCTCGQTRAAARPGRATTPSVNVPRDGIVRLLRDRKSRGGKTVTLVTGLSGSSAALAALASDLKRLCGTGGTMRGDVLELQGDFRERLRTELERRGYTVKIVGG
jgi:translation initiation factor 1